MACTCNKLDKQGKHIFA